jgi:hypothetical protein
VHIENNRTYEKIYMSNVANLASAAFRATVVSPQLSLISSTAVRNSSRQQHNQHLVRILMKHPEEIRRGLCKDILIILLTVACRIVSPEVIIKSCCARCGSAMKRSAT